MLRKVTQPKDAEVLTRRWQRQDGFSILEMLVVMGVMLVITAATMMLMRDSIKVSNTTYEMSDAQESLRNAQEYINRDLLSAGEGLSGIGTFNINSTFVRNYLTTNSVAGFAMIASDNDVAAGTSVRGTNPAVTVRSSPNLTDRLTVLSYDWSTTSTALPLAVGAGVSGLPIALNNNDATITVTSTVYNNATIGEIYCLTSGSKVTFATLTGKAAANKLLFNNGDTYGLNDGSIKSITSTNTAAATLMRMKIIHYFVNSNGMLIRRVFGVAGTGFTDDVIAEHVVDLQFNYVTKEDTADGVQKLPTAQLTSSVQQQSVRLVETTVTVETVHAVVKGAKQQVSMTASTSIRNLQFREIH